MNRTFLSAVCFAAGMGSALVAVRQGGTENPAPPVLGIRRQDTAGHPSASGLPTRASPDPSAQLLDALRTAVQTTDAARLRELLVNSPELSAPAALALLPAC